jgi:hypothetical protein
MTKPDTSFLCPSAQPDMPGSQLIGVVAGTPSEPRLAYVAEPRPISPELLALSENLNLRKFFASRRSVRNEPVSILMVNAVNLLRELFKFFGQSPKHCHFAEFVRAAGGLPKRDARHAIAARKSLRKTPLRHRGWYRRHSQLTWSEKSIRGLRVRDSTHH